LQITKNNTKLLSDRKFTWQYKVGISAWGSPHYHALLINT